LSYILVPFSCFIFQAEDGIRYRNVTGVQTCALPILRSLFFIQIIISIIMTEKSINDHHEIMICMKNKDRTKAASIMRENWLRTEIGRASCRERVYISVDE